MSQSKIPGRASLSFSASEGILDIDHIIQSNPWKQIHNFNTDDIGSIQTILNQFNQLMASEPKRRPEDPNASRSDHATPGEKKDEKSREINKIKTKKIMKKIEKIITVKEGTRLGCKPENNKKLSEKSSEYSSKEQKKRSIVAEEQPKKNSVDEFEGALEISAVPAIINKACTKRRNNIAKAAKNSTNTENSSSKLNVSNGKKRQRKNPLKSKNPPQQNPNEEFGGISEISKTSMGKKENRSKRENSVAKASMGLNKCCSKGEKEQKNISEKSEKQLNGAGSPKICLTPNTSTPKSEARLANNCDVKKSLPNLTNNAVLKSHSKRLNTKFPDPKPSSNLKNHPYSCSNVRSSKKISMIQSSTKKIGSVKFDSLENLHNTYNDLKIAKKRNKVTPSYRVNKMVHVGTCTPKSKASVKNSSDLSKPKITGTTKQYRGNSKKYEKLKGSKRATDKSKLSLLEKQLLKKELDRKIRKEQRREKKVARAITKLAYQVGKCLRKKSNFHEIGSQLDSHNSSSDSSEESSSSSTSSYESDEYSSYTDYSECSCSSCTSHEYSEYTISNSSFCSNDEYMD